METQKNLKETDGFDWLESTELAIDKRKFLLNRMFVSRSFYTLPPIRTNYGKFGIKFQGAKIWNGLSEETKSLHRLAFKKTLKREIIQSY